MTRDEAEFLLLCKAGAMTSEEVRELGKWWRRKLRGDLTRLRPRAATVAGLRAQGKTDANPACRRVTEAVTANRSLLVSTASALAEADRYEEFRADFEDIAAQAEALLAPGSPAAGP